MTTSGERKHLHSRVEVVRGDLTLQDVDAIVNAANSTLLGGGGVDGAIHRAAGPALLDACRNLGGCPTGQARMTPGFNLKARYVIHTVGPVWLDGAHDEDELLTQCYLNSLRLAREHSLASIAFPAISTGVYRFPLQRATEIAIAATLSQLELHAVPQRVRFVCFSAEAYDCYCSVLAGAN